MMRGNRYAAGYFVEHLEEAIDEGWLRVFYQPIMRTLTGEVSDVEALVRWYDPELGAQPPDNFIRAFEISGDIWRLDRAMLLLICRDLAERLTLGQPVVPVSLNVAWQEFLQEDMFEHFEEVLEEYDVPRDLLCLEITERAIGTEDVRLRRAVDQFRAAGYQVWLDDFGSEYSSLNVLKDYDFDLIKIDMRFLSSFSDKAKNIIASVVNMAKRIGVHTLAEGVETEAHAQFLHDIGCEKMQGYYYGKPLTLDELDKHVTTSGFRYEERRMHRYYTDADSCIHPVSEPMALLEYDGHKFRYLYVNDLYLKQLQSEGHATPEEAVNFANMPGSQLYQTFRSFADVARSEITPGEEQVFFYLSHENYMRLAARPVAEIENRVVFRLSLLNISNDQKVRDRFQLDSSLRNVYPLFDAIYLVDSGTDRVRPLFSRHTIAHDLRHETEGLEAVFKEYVEKNLHPDDQKRYVDFAQPKNVRRRMRQSENQVMAGFFRLKGITGEFAWKEVTLIGVPRTDGAQVIHCTKDAPMPRRDVLREMLRELGWQEAARQAIGLASKHQEERALLWETLMQSSQHACYFWKDKELRFRGVSQSFLEAYGLKSAASLIGKTDEEVGWHFDDAPMRAAELAVVERGVVLEDEPGECIIRGRMRSIVYSKRPIYRNGEIVGLLGKFEDEDAFKARQDKLSDACLLDPLTGMMNATGCVQTLFRCQQDKVLRGKAYGVVLLTVTTFRRVEQTYGESVGSGLLVRLAEEIVAVAGQTSTVARLAGATFAVVTFYQEPKEMDDLALTLHDALEKIHEAKGQDLTVRVETQVILDGKEGVPPEKIYQYAWEESVAKGA